MSEQESQQQTEEELPEILYHYCSNEAFYNIIKTGTLRMSDVTKSNDSMEQSLFIPEIFSELVAQYNENPFEIVSGIEESKTMMYQIILMIQAFSQNQFNKGINANYVCCFSEKADDLGQWRGYANDGKGCCIGFSREALENMCSDSNGMLKLVRVEYLTEEEKKLKIKQLAEELLLGLKRTINMLEDSYEDVPDVWQLAIPIFLEFNNIVNFDYSLRFKSDGFKEENEWRIYFSDVPYKIQNKNINNVQEEKWITNSESISRFINEKLDFRFTENDIIPFFPIDFSELKNDFLKEIWIGPKSKIRIVDLKVFLFKCNEKLNENRKYETSKEYYSDYDLHNSNITYR